METQKTESPWMTLEEVADTSRASLTAVRRWIAQGDLYSIRPGKRRLVHREDLTHFLRGEGHKQEYGKPSTEE